MLYLNGYDTGFKRPSLYGGDAVPSPYIASLGGG